MSYFVPYFDLICALFPWNHNSKITIWNNLESIISKIFPTAPTMVVPLKILQTLSPLISRITTWVLILSLFIWKINKDCALASENLPCPIKILVARLNASNIFFCDGNEKFRYLSHALLIKFLLFMAFYSGVYLSPDGNPSPDGTLVCMIYQNEKNLFFGCIPLYP